jgi:hypothetical protein
VQRVVQLQARDRRSAHAERAPVSHSQIRSPLLLDGSHQQPVRHLCSITRVKSTQCSQNKHTHFCRRGNSFFYCVHYHVKSNFAKCSCASRKSFCTLCRPTRAHQEHTRSHTRRAHRRTRDNRAMCTTPSGDAQSPSHTSNLPYTPDESCLDSSDTASTRAQTVPRVCARIVGVIDPHERFTDSSS